MTETRPDEEGRNSRSESISSRRDTGGWTADPSAVESGRVCRGWGANRVKRGSPHRRRAPWMRWFHHGAKRRLPQVRHLQQRKSAVESEALRKHDRHRPPSKSRSNLSEIQCLFHVDLESKQCYAKALVPRRDGRPPRRFRGCCELSPCDRGEPRCKPRCKPVSLLWFFYRRYTSSKMRY
jgi:hypothetical protein